MTSKSSNLKKKMKGWIILDWGLNWKTKSITKELIKKPPKELGPNLKEK